MYRFYANGELISPLYADSDTYLVSSPELELGLNRINTLTFQIHRHHPKLSSLAQRSTYIRVIDESEEIFYGRIIEADSDFYGTGEIICESELAFLRDSMMRPFVYRGSVSGFLSMLLDNHNQQVDAARKLELGTVTVVDNNDYILRSTSEAVDTWSLLVDKLVDLMGGFLRVRVADGARYLDYLADYGELDGQSVQFGQNLLDLVLSKNSGDIVTCLIPYGAEFEEEADGYEGEPESGSWAGNRLTIASVNGGKDYIESDTGIQLYGRVWGTEVWDDVTEPDNLLKKAQQWLESQAVCPESITASVVDLHLADRDIPRFRVGYWVEAFSRPHDLKIKLRISTIKMTLDDPTKDKITLGVERDSLTGRTAGTTASTRITLATIQQLQEASFSTIAATQIKTETLAADLIAANNLIAKKASIEQLNAVEAYITNLDAEKVSADELEAAVASIHKLLADYATIDHLEANYATIERLEAVVGSFETLLADYATIGHLEANYATIDKLNTDLANIKKLFADYARIDSLDAKYADIDFANIGMAAVDKLFSKSGIIKDLVVGDTSITGELVGVTIKGDLIDGNTIKADKLVVKGSDGLYYKLNVDAETVEAKQTDENSLNGSIITAKSITASKISVKDLVAFNATIGGYHITDTSLYSGAKASADNTTRGVYMDSDGQFSVGDASNYLRFFKGADGKYKLELSASSMLMATGQTVEDAISNVQGTIDKTRVVMLTSEACTFNGTTAGAPIGSTCSTQVLAYNGATPCKVTVGTVTCPTGITAVVTNNGTTSPTVTFKTTAVVSAAGTASIPVTVDGVSITKQFSFAVALTGATGAKGATGATGAAGKDGTDGKSIGSVINYYLATNSSSGVTTSTSGWTTTVQSVSATKKYLWNYEVIKYTDGTTVTTTAPCIIGSYGDTGAKGDTGAAGNGIKSITEYYAVSTSNSTAPTSWQTAVPTLTTTNRYLWNYETITYTNGATADTKKRVIGVYGNTGNAGVGIKSTAISYQISDSGTTIPTGTWSDSVPKATAAMPYVWSRTVITYTDGTSSTTYSVGSTLAGVAVGGRNILKGSAFLIEVKSGQNYAASNKHVYPEAKSTVINQVVTFSIYVHAPGARKPSPDVGEFMKNRFGAHLVAIWGDSTGTLTDRYVYPGAVSEILLYSGSGRRVHVTTTIVPPDGYDELKELYATIQTYATPAEDNDETWLIGYPKLELGNIATDWTPAPEDVDENIEKTATSKIEQFRDSITLNVTGADGAVSEIKMNDDGTMKLTGDVLAERLSVDKLMAGDITATGKIQFNNGRYSLLIDESTKQVSLKSWQELYIDGSDLILTSEIGNIGVSAAHNINIDGLSIALDCDAISLPDGTLSDYVIAVGASGIWNYQKFASGRTTIWARVTVSSAACTTALGDWYRTADVVGQVAWPYTLAGIPSVNVAFGADNTGALAWLKGQSTKDVFSGCYCVRPTSATLSGYICIQVMGWWK